MDTDAGPRSYPKLLQLSGGPTPAKPSHQALRKLSHFYTIGALGRICTENISLETALNFGPKF